MIVCPNEECKNAGKKGLKGQNFCGLCGSELEVRLDPIIKTMYLHSDKDSLYELGDEIGLSDVALAAFAYTACELELRIIVDPQTGITKLEAVKESGTGWVSLERPITI